MIAGFITYVQHIQHWIVITLSVARHDGIIKWSHFRVTGHLCGEFTVTDEFPTQRPVTRSFDLHLNKRLSKQSWGWWFETLSRPLWRHCNDFVRSRRPFRMASPDPLESLKIIDGSPSLLRWWCCHGGGFPLQYVRACFMTHSFLTLGIISYDDVYITNGVYIFMRKILWSCTVVLLRMSVSFTMYLVRDDLINKWNQSLIVPSYSVSCFI